MSCATIPATSLPCALILDMLSKHAEYKVTIAEEGCIPAIVTLLRSSEDVPTQYHALMTLCSILTREENHAPILQQGALASILALTTHGNQSIREACALVLFNFSCGTAVQERIVQAGAVPAIIALSTAGDGVDGVDVASQRRCAAALCNLACTPSNIARMVEEGVIPSIIHLLKTGDILCVKYCCAALCLVAQDVRNCVLIINEGAIPHMLAGAKDGDVVTKQSCCAVLSTLSSKEECREQLCNCGALPALIQLASMEDEATKLRCVIAFANLSCEYMIQKQMVEAGVVTVLTELSSSYREKNQLYCARALCNLACHHGSEKALVEGGGVAALMMIALVRSVSLETKQICAKALLNLIAEDTLPILIEEGLVSAATNLGKLDDEDSMRACATVFAFLSADPNGRAKFVERKSALVSLFDLLRSKDPGTKVICGKAVCNLVACTDSQLAAVEAGAVPCLRQLAKLGVPEIEASIAMTFLLMSGNSRCRREVVTTALATVVYLSRSPNAEARFTCARTLGILAQHEDSRAALSAVGVARALVGIIEDYTEGDLEHKNQLRMCTRALYYLTTNQDSVGYMVEAGGIRALSRVMEIEVGEYEPGLVAAALRCLSQAASIKAGTGSRTDRKQSEGGSGKGTGEGAHEASKMANLFASQGAGNLLRRLVEAAGSCEATLYDCAVVVYNLAGAMLNVTDCSALCEDLVGENGVLPAMEALANVRSAQELVMATLTLLSNDPGSRERVIANGGVDLVLSLAGGPEDWVNRSPDVVTNAVCAFLLLTRAPPAARGRLKEGGKVTHLLANLSKHGSEVQKKVASDALGNLTQDVGLGIEEGTVSALISRSLEGPGDMDREDDIITSVYVAPQISTTRIKEQDPEAEPSGDAAIYKVQSVTPVKQSSGGGGDLPPPPEPPAIDGQDLSVPTPPSGFRDHVGEDEDGDEPKALQFAKMDVPPEYMLGNDEGFILSMEERKGAGRPYCQESSVKSGELIAAGNTGGKEGIGEGGDHGGISVAMPPCEDGRTVPAATSMGVVKSKGAPMQAPEVGNKKLAQPKADAKRAASKKCKSSPNTSEHLGQGPGATPKDPTPNYTKSRNKDATGRETSRNGARSEEVKLDRGGQARLAERSLSLRGNPPGESLPLDEKAAALGLYS